MVPAPERFVSSSPNRLVRRFLDRVQLPVQREFFEELLGAPLREEPEALKLFPPSNRSKDVRDALRRRAEAAGATLRMSAPVRSLERRGDGFRIALDGEAIEAAAVIVTTGGLSVLGGGADARGLDWAAAMGHTVVAPYAALAPLVAEGAPHAALSGLSLPARLTARGAGESAVSEGGFLFTHRGYSGPSALDVSHVVERHGPAARVTARFGGDVDWDAELRAASGTVASFLRKRFPDRLADLLLRESGTLDTPLHRLTREKRGDVVRALTAFPLPATGTEGYRTAEVMGGGVALPEVDPGSGESKLVPGLYFAGEILDAFGPIGGFNFQWAWATGWTAGAAAARKVSPSG